MAVKINLKGPKYILLFFHKILITHMAGVTSLPEGAYPSGAYDLTCLVEVHA